MREPKTESLIRRVAGGLVVGLTQELRAVFGLAQDYQSRAQDCTAAHQCLTEFIIVR
jgi:hypothetical protein